MADKPITNDAQAHDLREGDEPVVEAGIENALSADEKTAASAAAAASAPDEGDKKDAAGKAKVAKAAGVKTADVTGYNADTQTIVTAQGSKFRMAADGKSAVRLSGPAADSDAYKKS